MATPLITPYLDIHETSAITRTGVSTLRRYVRSGELPASRMGTKLIFDPADVAAFVRGRRVRPRSISA